MSYDEPNDPNMILSPLADPVVSAVFADEEVSGLASESLIKCILEPDEKLLGKVVRVTPQKSYSDPFSRGSRVDVDIETDANEKAIFEINIYTDKTIMHRNIFTSSHIFKSTSSKGDTTVQMVAKMPKVIFINILMYNIRNDNTDLVQPFKIMFTKPPQRAAIPQFSGYNIQLPRINEMEPDFTSGLYCWCYTLYTAHTENKTIQEVLNMTPELLSYAEREPGYFQFCQRYGLVSADPDTRHEYFLWLKDRWREEGVRISAIEEGLEQGLEQGLKQGMEEGRLKAIVNQINIKKLKSKTRQQIIEELELSESDIEVLDNFENYTHLLDFSSP